MPPDNAASRPERIRFTVAVTTTLEPLWYDEQWHRELVADGMTDEQALTEMIRIGCQEDRRVSCGRCSGHRPRWRTGWPDRSRGFTLSDNAASRPGRSQEPEQSHDHAQPRGRVRSDTPSPGSVEGDVAAQIPEPDVQGARLVRQGPSGLTAGSGAPAGSNAPTAASPSLTPRRSSSDV